jgi:hypothetical protein
MSLVEPDLKNLLLLINFAFQNGMVKAQDDARALLMLEHKLKTMLEEGANGDHVQDGTE